MLRLVLALTCSSVLLLACEPEAPVVAAAPLYEVLELPCGTDPELGFDAEPVSWMQCSADPNYNCIPAPYGRNRNGTWYVSCDWEGATTTRIVVLCRDGGPLEGCLPGWSDLD